MKKCPFCEARLRSGLPWLNHVMCKHLTIGNGYRCVEVTCCCGDVFLARRHGRLYHECSALETHWKDQGGIYTHYLECQLLAKT